MNTRKIISASRRSDIPAFYSPWFKKRVEEGFCHVINPYNQKVFRVSFLPEDVLGFVFWTRNPAPLLKYLDLFDRLGFSYCFHFTITGYGAPLETSTPPLQTAIRLFKKLSRKVTPSRIFWRYDPIILSSLTPIEFHIENFGNIASQLSKYTGVSIISFIDFYKKTKKNLQDLEASNGLSLLDFSGAGKGELTRNLESIAAKNNMKLETCCEEDLDTLGFNKAACINRDIFFNSRNLPVQLKKRPTRKGCGCVDSVDVGTYNTCLSGCTYCYATISRQGAMKNYQNSDPEDSMLSRPEKYAGIDFDKLDKKN